ncbi:MAG: T9SS type A sorting domain-containing protein [Flavobacteriales bacterium]|nr:T9SS type A sorting domain-containing protein [Flavobacteriales bacterium]MCB9167555.1 T9SS type A sorting domain-containing protein [Flavobacteriales bacterium]
MDHRPLLALVLGVTTLSAAAQQRYLEEVFTNSEISISSGISYGVNIDFLPPSNVQDPGAPAEIVQLQTLVSTQQPIPPAFFDPNDGSTVVKVKDLQMDVYQPDQGIDTETARPVVLYLHTGNALPPPTNGSPTGLRTDSCAVEICKQMARRGYVAISMDYRLGWNPLAATEEERRGQLLNAIYRAIHDVRQCVRNLKADAAGVNTWGVDPTKIIVLGEGTGGYIALANATLDDPAELFIEKFRPDPFDPTVSYVDTTLVGNLAGFNGQLTLYRPNGFDYETQFCVNLGGALADTSWVAPGDVPMVAFHTVFDPFAPFTEGIVIVPTTGGPVVPVQGSNLFEQLINTYGNNASFATLPGGDPYTDAARALYGQTIDGVMISPAPEGLFPFIRPRWPAPAMDEASPWQWWDPNSPLAQVEIMPGVTTNDASLASNPDMSPTKGRTYIDTIMGYMNPRIVCALDLGPCSLVGIDEGDPIAQGVHLYPTPATDRVTITSDAATIRMYTLYDVNGRQVDAANVEALQFDLPRKALRNGTYFIQLQFDQGAVTRKLVFN